MKHSSLVLLGTLILAGCDVETTEISFGGGANTRVVGTWSGVAEISTAEDIATNVGAPSDRGFTFPLVINFESNGWFTLITAGYPTSYNDEMRRTCSGAYIRDGNTISFYPTESCRALPMTTYNLGGVAPNGITLLARSNVVNNPSASYLTMRVFIRLDRD